VEALGEERAAAMDGWADREPAKVVGSTMLSLIWRDLVGGGAPPFQSGAW